MRTTLTLDDDVVAMIDRTRKARDQSFREVVNEALREGLQRLGEPKPHRKPFRTESVDLGEIYLPNIDNIAEVLDLVEGEWRR